MDMTEQPEKENDIPEQAIEGADDPETSEIPVDAAPEVTADAAADTATDTAEVEPTAAEDIDTLKSEIERLKGDYMRALADAENARRMAQKKVEDNTRYALNNFAKDLLSVTDNLGRALHAIPSDARATNDVVNTLATGIEMTEKELLAVLSRHGTTRLNSQNQPFNPHHHQAMQEVENTDVPTGTVVQVYQDGWMMHDRLLRPAMVVVSKGGPKPTPAPDTSPSSGDESPETGIDMSA